MGCQLEVRLSDKAIKDGVLRVWLRRIPEVSGILRAFAVDKPEIEQPVGMATLYGRGISSSAEERTMLYFVLSRDLPTGSLLVGDLIEIKIEGKELGVYEELELDIIEVE